MEKYWFKSNIFAQLSEIVEADSEKEVIDKIKNRKSFEIKQEDLNVYPSSIEITKIKEKKEKSNMEYNKENYKGRRIRLYPHDTYMQEGIITNVDDLGFTVLITKADEKSDYKVGCAYFLNHAKHLKFCFLD